MKNIFKSLLAVSTLSLALISCEDEQDLFFLTPEAEFEILSPNSGDAVELNPETTTNPGLSLTWSEADFGTPTEITGQVQVHESKQEELIRLVRGIKRDKETASDSKEISAED